MQPFRLKSSDPKNWILNERLAKGKGDLNICWKNSDFKTFIAHLLYLTFNNLCYG